ncbi:MAG: S9 family peptidase [Nannocystaceae bacterium]
MLRIRPCLALASTLLLAACTGGGGGAPDSPGGGGGATPPPGPEVDAGPRPPGYEARLFHESLSVVPAGFTHDESALLVSTDRSGAFGVEALPVAGGEAKAWTQPGADNHRAVSTFPADDRFLYLADHGGDELDHLFVAGGGAAPRDLTPGDGVKASFRGWSRDGASFYVLTNERDPRFFDLYRHDAATYERALVFQNDGGYAIEAVDRGGRFVAVSQTNDHRDADVLLAPLPPVGKAASPKAKPRMIKVSTGKEPAMESAQTFSPDGATLYYSTDAHGEFLEIWAYDLAKKTHSLAFKAEWDVLDFEFSEEGTYRAVTINRDGRAEVEVVRVADGSPVALPGLGADEYADGVLFARSEERLAVLVASARSTPNLHYVDLKGASDRRLTSTLNPAIDPARLVESEVVRFPSYDGREIPAVLYRPIGAGPDAKVPVIVWMHGGPGGQTTRDYSATFQHAAAHGYALLGVNNRGSSGYGKTFFHLDDRGHGDVDLRDCVAAHGWLRAQPWVDGERIAIAGGSYGGYLVLAALAFQPEVFAVGVDLFGVANFLRTLESVPPWWTAMKARLHAEIGDPKTDRARLEAISPLLHADQIRRPLLVIQGANDPRVLKVESDEIVAALEKNKVPVEYLVFPDEGHGFRKRANRIAADAAMVRFLDAHLRE